MSDTTTETSEERKARRVAARAERRAERMNGTGEQRFTLFLDPGLSARLTLLAQSTGRSPEEEAQAAVEQVLKGTAAVKAIASQKETMRAKIAADRAAADAEFAKRLDLIENL